MHRPVGDSFWLLGQSIYTMTLGLFMTGIAARSYGPSAFGLLAVAIAIVLVATPLATLGMDSVVIHNLVKGDRDDRVILRTSLILRLAAGMTLFGCLAIGTAFLDSARYDHAVILALGLTLVLRTGEGYLPWFQARSEIPRSSLARVIAYSVTVAARGLVLAMGLPLAAYAFTYALDAALVWLLLLAARRRRSPEAVARPKFSADLARVLLARSWPLMLSGLGVALYNRVDQIMLGFMLPIQSDVGRYAASVTLAESWYFIPLAVVVARQARVMRAHESSELLFHQESQRLFDHAIWLSLLCALLIGSLSPLLMTLLFGTDFVTHDSIISASLLSAAGALAVTGSARGPWLIARGLEIYTLIYLGAGTLINILLNLALIPWLGFVGAAIATLSAQAISVVILPALIPITRPSVRFMVKAVSLRRFWGDRSSVSKREA